ncbi:MAG: GreA/GreB family elongation factor [Burkholderiaceae bacterium]|nr:GreA/GreB family elongation factor [Burkholderiaceae bacterium]
MRPKLEEDEMANSPEMFVCSDDAVVLARLLDDRCTDAALATDEKGGLAEKLVEARIVAPRALPRGVVRLDSRVVYEELPAGPRRQVMVVNPRDADAAAGRISVLSPIGRALLGNGAGAVIEVALPAGRSLFVRIVEVGAHERAANAELVHA